MTVIVCVDDDGGMLFGGRRQSRDRALRARILEQTAGGELWMNAFSASQFAPDLPQLRVDENFLNRAPAEAVCFVEDRSLARYAGRIDRVVVYRWNRHYPADVRLDLDLSKPPWRLRCRTEFPGFSHEFITEEVYER